MPFLKHGRQVFSWLTTPICILFLSQTVAMAAPPEGHWKGAIQIPGTTLEIDVDLALKPDGAWSGDISIPLQQAKDLPLGNIEVQGAKISFSIVGVPGEPKFTGVLSAKQDSIDGEFAQAGQTFPFQLKAEANPADQSRQALAGFDALVEQALKDFETPGAAMAIVVDGKVVLAKGWGVRDIETKKPVTENTIFAIGSTTKAFTTFVMGVLADQGKLDLDQPVKDYLPGFKLYDPITTELITPRDLVTHRSGLPRHDMLWYNSALSGSELVSRLQYLQPNQKLRAKFQYNNGMFMAAGHLIEKVTGKTWEDNVRTLIFEPLAMQHSNFSVHDSQKSEDFAQPHALRDEKLQKIAFRDINNAGPAGAINATAADMSNWLLLHLAKGKFKEKRLIGEATLADIHSPQMVTGATLERPEISQAAYGLGWFIDTYRGHRRLHHGGGIDGFITMVTLFPDDGIGVVAFVNTSSSGLPELLTRHAIDLILDMKPIDWLGESLARYKAGKELSKEGKEKKAQFRKADTKPSHKLEDYTGDYEHPGYGTLTVSLKDKQLSFTYNKITSPLEHWHYEVWNTGKNEADPVLADVKLQFQGDIKGNVAAVSIALEPQVDDIVFKKKPSSRLFDPVYLARYAGSYDLAGESMEISVHGNALTVSLPGQPMYHLKPALGDEFTLEEYSTITVRFEEDQQGKVDSLTLIQPEGIFTAKRKPTP